MLQQLNQIFVCRSHRHTSGPTMRLGSFLPVVYGGAGYGSSGGGIGGVLIWVVAAAILFGVVTSFLDNRDSDQPLLSELSAAAETCIHADWLPCFRILHTCAEIKRLHAAHALPVQ